MAWIPTLCQEKQWTINSFLVEGEPVFFENSSSDNVRILQWRTTQEYMVSAIWTWYVYKNGYKVEWVEKQGWNQREIGDKWKWSKHIEQKKMYHYNMEKKTKCSKSSSLKQLLWRCSWENKFRNIGKGVRPNRKILGKS